MATASEHPMQWCLRQAKLAGPDAEVCVSLYFFGEETPGFAMYEVGISLTVGSQTRRIPLNYTHTGALRMQDSGMYECYSFLADDYVNHLLKQGLSARRELADFERQLLQSSPSVAAKS